MYHGSKYEAHNKALNSFIESFNKIAIEKGNEIEMYFQETENYRDDGGIYYKKNGHKILYDFEKRFSYYNTCNSFKFKTLGQFERKIRKPEIKLSIQCSNDEKCFIIAWHEDFMKEEKRIIGSKTEKTTKEYDGKRFTNAFLEIKYSQFEHFYDILLYAFIHNMFNEKSFSAIKAK